MAKKPGLAVAQAATSGEPQPSLVANPNSEGLRLVKSALESGRVVSTEGLSRTEYITRLLTRNGK